MKKIYFLFIAVIISSMANAQQSTAWTAPDSAFNVAKPGAGPSPAWNITNPLNHSGTAFGNTPINSGFQNNISDYLYFRNFGLSIPSTATITGVEIIVSRGACNGGNYYHDTASLAYNGAAIGDYVEDSTYETSAVDTFGSDSDLWGNVLTPAMVNSDSFGVFFSFHSFGICTFGVFDCRIKVHYTIAVGVNEVVIADRTIIYPNPATNVVNVQSTAIDFTVTDCMGRVVLNGATNKGTAKIDIASLPTGLYYLRSGNTVTKFVKN